MGKISGQNKGDNSASETAAGGVLRDCLQRRLPLGYVPIKLRAESLVSISQDFPHSLHSRIAIINLIRALPFSFTFALMPSVSRYIK